MSDLAETTVDDAKPSLFKKISNKYFFTRQKHELPQSNLYTAESGINSLITAAQPLISIISRVKQSPNLKVLADLKRNVQYELQVFEKYSLQSGINMEQVLMGRYCLSAMLDEVMLDSALGHEWQKCQLLPIQKDQEPPQEQFFKLVERLQQEPEENIICLELMYLLLSLGFQGKYRNYPNRDYHLNFVIDGLYEAIRLYRGCYQTDFLIANKKTFSRKSLTKILWRFVIILALVLWLVFVGFNYVLDVSAGFVVKEINDIVSWLN